MSAKQLKEHKINMHRNKPKVHPMKSTCNSCEAFRREEEEGEYPWGDHTSIWETRFNSSHRADCQKEYDENLRCPFCKKSPIKW